MGFLLKIVIFVIAVYGIWAMAMRWYRLLGGGQARPPAPPDRRETAAAPPSPPPRRPVIEETRLCAACGSYVAAGAARCGRPDCPQPA